MIVPNKCDARGLSANITYTDLNTEPKVNSSDGSLTDITTLNV